MRNRRPLAMYDRDTWSRFPVIDTRFDWPTSIMELDWPSQLFRSDDEAVKVEEFREGQDLVIRADLPGIDPDKDVNISISNGVLQIRAERRAETAEAGRDYYRSEVRYGSFERSLPLPANANGDDVKANYTDGVLEVRVHVPEEPKVETKVPVTRT